jgi:hypothetical protein
MANLGRWQSFITDNSGAIISGATVTVRDESTGNLAVLYSDRAGTVLAGNPVYSDGNGYVYFHAASSAYRIQVTSGSYTADLRYVVIGVTAGEGINVDQADAAANPTISLGSYTPSFTGGASRTVVGKLGEPWLSSADFGAIADAQYFQSSAATISAGSPALTAVGGSFVVGDVGKAIQVAGAGAAGAALVTTIAGWTSATQITLSANAGTALAGVSTNILYGTDNTTTLQAWLTACQTNFVPGLFVAGVYMITAALTITSGIFITGQGPYNTTLRPVANIDAITITTNSVCDIRDLAINYTVAGVAGTTAIRVTATTGENIGSAFRRIFFQYANCGIAFIKAQSWNIESCFFDMFYSITTAQGVYISNTNNVDQGNGIIFGSTFVANGQGSGIEWVSAGGIRILGNTFNALNIAVYVHLASGADTTDIWIGHNHIENSTTTAIYFVRAGATGTLGNISICSCEFYQNSCISVPADANGVWLNNISIVGNTFSTIGTGAGYVIELNSMVLGAISGNTFKGLGATTALYYLGATAANIVATCNPANAITGASTVNSTATNLDFPMSTVAALPAVGANSAGSRIFATNGRNSGEGAAAGTGCWCYSNSAGAWLAVWSGLAVTS